MLRTDPKASKRMKKAKSRARDSATGEATLWSLNPEVENRTKSTALPSRSWPSRERSGLSS